jgi:hypothetical protein
MLKLYIIFGHLSFIDKERGYIAMNNVVEKKKEVLIDGMDKKMAKRYLEYRKRIDHLLIQIAGLGRAIVFMGNTNDDVEPEDFMVLGNMIIEKANGVLEKIDEMKPDIRVYFKLMEIDNPKEYEKLVRKD